MEKIKATVKAWSPKTGGILLVDETGNEVWYQKSDAVDWKWVRKGECEATLEHDQETGQYVISFLKINSAVPSQFGGAGFKKPFVPFEKKIFSRDPEEQKKISAQWAINASIQTLLLKPKLIENIAVIQELEKIIEELADRYLKMSVRILHPQEDFSDSVF